MGDIAGVKTVWIDNPPVNVITTGVAASIRRGLEELTPDTRVVVLRGAGDRAFSAGADLSAIEGAGVNAPPAEVQPVADLIEAAPVPVVAAIHGYCLGGGLELALACDVRIARADAQFAFPEIGHGFIPGGGGTQRAPRLIGRGRAAWLIMSGERISAEQAERWALVELVVDDLDSGVERVAGTLAAQSPVALREAKQLLLATRDERSDRAELEAFVRCVESEDGREGIAAFLEKRKPVWTGR